MIDSLDWMLERTAPNAVPEDLDEFGMVTVHRQGNVDDEPTLRRIVKGLELISERLPLVWPMHPRTSARVAEAGLDIQGRIRVVPPMAYSEFVTLLARARVILTDSGGIQEESMVLGVPCITLRENTERPVTLGGGANQIVGTDPNRIYETARSTLAGPPVTAVRPPLWDGHAGERIAAILGEALARPVDAVGATTGE
jgi:UDP-N-acetylglucosamine 2-epimerase (non-hydrolysing)